MNKSQLNSTQRALVAIQGIQSGALAIAVIFLSLYLYQRGGLKYIALFYVADYILQSVFFVVSGYLLRRFTTSQSIRVGLLLSCVAYLSLLVCGKDAPHYTVLLGCIMGVSDGLYWASVNLTEWVCTHEDGRNTYLSRMFSVSAMMQVVGPVVAGSVLTAATWVWSRNVGYYLVFGLLILFWLTGAVLAGRLPALTGVRYELRNPNRPAALRRTWREVLGQSVLRGFWVEPLNCFVAVLLLLVLHSSFAVAVVSASTTLLVSVASLIVGLTVGSWPRTFWIGALVVPIGMVIFGVSHDWVGIVAYVIGIMVCDLFANTTWFKLAYDVIDDHNHRWSEAFYLIVQREVVLNAARIVAFGALFVLLSSHNDAHILRNGLILASILPVLNGLLHVDIVRRRSATSHGLTPNGLSEP
jgi:MFS transporter, YQGE family, putative transporter